MVPLPILKVLSMLTWSLQHTQTSILSQHASMCYMSDNLVWLRPGQSRLYCHILSQNVWPSDITSYQPFLLRPTIRLPQTNGVLVSIGMTGMFDPFPLWLHQIGFWHRLLTIVFQWHDVLPSRHLTLLQGRRIGPSMGWCHLWALKQLYPPRRGYVSNWDRVGQKWRENHFKDIL